MCGIAGVITPAARTKEVLHETALIRNMIHSIGHRGPDGEAYWNSDDSRVLFGHRRLAIIDTSLAGAQPMHYAGRYTIVYNGELYNFIELRSELREAGYDFRTQSDTEVILAAFDCYGEGCMERFDGMFAFAIWDDETKRLFLARDRFGEKPLYFAWSSTRNFLFASEMKALWAAGIPQRMDESQVLLFTATGNTGYPLQNSSTFYKDILQVPAAHYLTMQCHNGETAEPEIYRYWDIEKTVSSRLAPEEAILKLDALLTRSVRQRLRSDVPVGLSLSGGVDSSSLAALVNRITGNGLESFSAGFPGFEKDETDFINEISRYLGIANHKIDPDHNILADDFERMMHHQEQPVGSASVLVQYKVYQLAAQSGVKVILDGQGADELFAGYYPYIHWFLQESWRKGNWTEHFSEKEAFSKNGWKDNAGWKNYMAAIFPHIAQESLIRRQKKLIGNQPAINPDYLKAHMPDTEVYKPLVTSLNDILYFDITMARLPELLRYADRNSMAHGIEVRLPYLQPDLVQFVFSLPSAFKLKDGYTKWILRKTIGNLLPQEITWQKRKIAFEPPQQSWMNNPSVKAQVSAAKKKLASKGILSKKVLAKETSGTNDWESDWRYWVLSVLPG